MLQTVEDVPNLQALLSKVPEFSLVASNLNHEIRTPLAVIQSSSELINVFGQSMTQKERQELFDAIYQAVLQIKDALPKDYL